ncbi:MAG: transaminase [Actinomycetes bacterium]
MTAGADRARLARLLDRERATHLERHPVSATAHRRAERSLLGGVPMTWMAKNAGAHPVWLDGARGAHLECVDGHEYIDFSLGDTGAMAGHSPPPVVDAIGRRLVDAGGATTMLPSEDAAWVGEELTRRFGLPQWSLSLSATDANRWALRLARMLTGRSKVLVFSWCYHGTVDETFAVLTPDGARSRAGNVGPPVDPTVTTRVAEFNDLDGLERELAAGDVACVLAEPALTNIGIVLPDPGFLEGVRALTRATGTLLVIDETHTFSAGPGGATAAWGLEPDMTTLGKAIGGGVPAGAYGMTAELAERALSSRDADLVDTGGVGGTLAGNALSVAAVRATLEHVLTPDAFGRMGALASRFADGVEDALERHGLPWSVSTLGARTEYRFASPAPRTGTASAAAADPELDDYLHLFTANRGVLMTPFHNMALMCPDTTQDDVDRHTDVFEAALDDLVGA